MKSKIEEIPIGKIRISKNQPRNQFDISSIHDLANSIKENGLIQPIIVRKEIDGYELVAGERRLRAVQSLNQESIEAIIQNYDEETSARVSLIENIQRENLSPIEEAIAYEKLIKGFNYTQTELAKSLGKTQSSIANKMRLLQLDDDIKQLLSTRILSERHGRALLKIKNSEKRSKIANKIVEQNLNVNQAEILIDKVTSENKKPKQKKVISKIDYRLEINTIKQTLELIEKNGVEVKYEIINNEDGVKIEIQLKK